MKLSQAIVDIDTIRGAKLARLTPRRHYPTVRPTLRPTVRLKPFRRGPLGRLAWIFGFAR
jgi:hypothetical protein